MKRKLTQSLQKWAASLDHKPLIIRGARQVWKTYLLKEFGQFFKGFDFCFHGRLCFTKTFFCLGAQRYFFIFPPPPPLRVGPPAMGAEILSSR
jgi:hypothetical protein